MDYHQMIKHYVLTRSSYGPEWSREANIRRLKITEGVTVEMMRRQTNKDWTWLVLLDERDPLLDDRLFAFMSAGVSVKPIFWAPDQKDAKLASWDKQARLFTGKLDAEQEARSAKNRIAATAYKIDWAAHMEPGRRMMTRIDDDDAFTRDALERVATAARHAKERRVLMQPMGYRVWEGKATLVKHTTNAMHTLFAPAGDDLTVYDYGHRKCSLIAPVQIVDKLPAWLWVRHPDTISGWKKADRPITNGLKRMFPIDWSLI